MRQDRAQLDRSSPSINEQEGLSGVGTGGGGGGGSKGRATDTNDLLKKSWHLLF